MNLLYDTKLVISSNLGEKFLPKDIVPKLAVINLTENCNSRCITCTCWRQISKDKISKQQAIDFLLELKDLGIEMIRFSGGDPFVRRDFFEILSAIPQNTFKKVVVATNGLLVGKYKEEINNSIITNLSVSFDGVGENNDKIRGIPGYFDKVITNLKGINKSIKIVSGLSNVLAEDIDKIIDIAQKSGYGFDVNLLDSNPYFFDNEDVKKEVNNLKPTLEQVKKIIEAMKKNKLLNPNIEKNILEYSKNGKFCFKHCVLGYFCVYVSSNGDVRTGCYVYEPVGNILDKTISDIMESNEYKNTVMNMYNLKCPLCTCGYGISAAYSKPVLSMNYIKRKLK